MGRNVELKARLRDPVRQAAIAAALGDRSAEVIRQEDFFFRVPRGRLKLRVLGPRRGELIFYQREDRPDPRPSEYLICPTDDPSSLKRLLEAGLGLRGTVRKTRTLYMSGRTRIHLDEVEGLGSFLELEVVLAPGETPGEGMKEAHLLAGRLGIESSDHVGQAYIDLLEKGATGKRPAGSF